MPITQKHVDALMAALTGEGASAPVRDETRQLHIGAVWYGDWLHDADSGRFGRPEKPHHNACISHRNKLKTRFRMAPITSQKKSGPNVVFLPAGTIPGGALTASYMLVKVKLQIDREHLENRFMYKCNLPPAYVQDMRETIRR